MQSFLVLLQAETTGKKETFLGGENIHIYCWAVKCEEVYLFLDEIGYYFGKAICW